MKVLRFSKQNDIKKCIPVTVSEIYQKRDFHKEGLFSQYIFGPTKDYTCQCGKYEGKKYEGSRCETCNVLIVSSDVRRSKFSRIDLPMPVIHPLALTIAQKAFGKKVVSMVISTSTLNTTRFFKIEKGMLVETTKEDGKRGIELFKDIIEFGKITSKDNEYMRDILKSNMEDIIMSSVPVLPPDLRPAVSVSKNHMMLDNINDNYRRLIQITNILKQLLVVNEDIYHSEYVKLQASIIELFQNIKQKLAKKEGLIRSNLLGKRIDFSGRAVIVPDPTLKYDHCLLPHEIAKEIFKVHVVGAARKDFYIPSEVVELMKTGSKEFDGYLEKVMMNYPVLLNRQPTLHRQGVQGFYAGITKDFVIKIHPLVCNAYNADFDGDQMAVYVPVTKDARKEVVQKVMSHDQILDANGNPLLSLTQDIVLGLYYLTLDIKDGDPIREKVEYKGKTITKGRALFNSTLRDFPYVIDVPVTKKVLMNIIHLLTKDRSNFKGISNILDDIMKLGFEYSTLKFPLSIKSFKIGDPILKAKEMIKDSNTRVGSKVLDITGTKMKEWFKIHRNDTAVYDIIESGARGSWDQVQQVSLCKGYLSNADGKIISTPVVNSLLEGLTPSELFFSSYGARKGLLDKAMNTANSGYLTRKLVYALGSVTLSGNHDCGTTRYLEKQIPEENYQVFTDRYYLDSDGTLKVTDVDFLKKNIGNKIKFRSPVYCQEPDGKLCKTCYGTLFNGNNVGFISAQTIGEKGTQLTLRTFHTAGIATIGSYEVDETAFDLQEEFITAKVDGTLIVESFDGRTLDESSRLIYVKKGKEPIKVEQKFPVGSIINIKDPDKTESDTNSVKSVWSFRKGDMIVKCPLSQLDIVNDLSAIKNLLHKPVPDVNFILDSLQTIYNRYGSTKSVHFEIIISQLMYVLNGDNTITKLRYSDKMDANRAISLIKVPRYESWLLGVLFERVDLGLVDGLLCDGKTIRSESILETIATMSI